MRAAPSQREAAPTTATVIGRVSIPSSVRRRQPLETKRRREAVCGSAGRGAPPRD
jgi:hypothetical protein